MRLFQKLHAVTKKFFAEVLLDDLARGRIDIKSLPSPMRRYVISSIILLCITLLGTIILYFYDGLLPCITFSYYNSPFTVSYLTLTISIITYILGWTFLLMGGIWSNIILFAFLAIYFIFVTGYICLGHSNPWWILLLFGFITALLIPSFKHSMHIRPALRYITLLLLCFPIAFLSIFVTPIRRYVPGDYTKWLVVGLTICIFSLVSSLGHLKKWQFPEERFVGIGRIIALSIIIIFLGILLRPTFQVSQFTETLFTAFNQITTYISLFWFILGFSALWGVINLSEWTRDALGILFPKKIIFAIVFTFWAVVIFLKLYPFDLPLTWDLSLSWTFWAILGATAFLYKRFTISRILSLFQLTIFVLLLTQAYYALILQTVTETEFQIGSLTIFIIGLTWLLFQGSGIIINSSSKWFPRNSRLFLFFGLIFLMLGLNHLMLIARFKEFMNTVKLSAFTGFLYTGPPFILYLWLVKRLKHHPVRPSQLAYLSIWGAILVHPAIALRQVLLYYGTPIILLIGILSIIQEYLKLYVIRKITYHAPTFNEPIDGIIYASSIALGWIIFEQNPQFAILPIRIPLICNIGPEPIISAPLWYKFSLQFACAGLLGYGLSKTKLAGIPYKKANIFLVKPLFLGWVLAVVYRYIMDIIFSAYLNQILSTGLIWGLTCISLVVAIVTVRKSLR